MLSFPASPTTGQQYTDSNGKVWEYDGVKWNISTTPGIKQFFGAKISLSTPFFLTNTLQAVEFDVEDIDTAALYNANTPTILTIPRTGYYRVHASIKTGQEGFGASYSVDIRRNSSSLLTTSMSAYQTGVYDEVLLLNAGDTISIHSSESENIGSLEADTFLEVILQGYTFGASIVPGFEFSGVKATLQNDVTTTSTPTAITWASGDIDFNVNANAAGNVYWTNTNATRFTVYTTGYYRINAYFLTNTDGSSETYTVTIKKNGTTDVETITLGGNESAELDETYQFNSTDYLEIVVSNSEALGAIKQTESFFQMVRLGV
jgi:hypothetical protein